MASYLHPARQSKQKLELDSGSRDKVMAFLTFRRINRHKCYIFLGKNDLQHSSPKKKKGHTEAVQSKYIWCDMLSRCTVLLYVFVNKTQYNIDKLAYD